MFVVVYAPFSPYLRMLYNDFIQSEVWGLMPFPRTLITKLTNEGNIYLQPFLFFSIHSVILYTPPPRLIFRLKRKKDQSRIYTPQNQLFKILDPLNLQGLKLKMMTLVAAKCKIPEQTRLSFLHNTFFLHFNSNQGTVNPIKVLTTCMYLVLIKT